MGSSVKGRSAPGEFWLDFLLQLLSASPAGIVNGIFRSWILTVPAFLGDYEVVVESGGTKVSRNVALKQGGADVSIELQP